MEYFSQKEIERMGKSGTRYYLKKWLPYVPAASRDAFAQGFWAYRKLGDLENPKTDYRKRISKLSKSRFADHNSDIMFKFGAATRCIFEDGCNLQSIESLDIVRGGHSTHERGHLHELYKLLDGDGVMNGKDKYREITFTAFTAFEKRHDIRNRKMLKLPKRIHGPFGHYF